MQGHNALDIGQHPTERFLVWLGCRRGFVQGTGLLKLVLGQGFAGCNGRLTGDGIRLRCHQVNRLPNLS